MLYRNYFLKLEDFFAHYKLWLLSWVFGVLGGNGARRQYGIATTHHYYKHNTANLILLCLILFGAGFAGFVWWLFIN